MRDLINGQFTSWSKDEKLEGVHFGVHLLYLQMFIMRVMARRKCRSGLSPVSLQAPAVPLDQQDKKLIK